MANSKIKGITIEINGDVTKLDQALRKADNSVKTVERSLREVEKALKLDPKNIDLLAQKEELLKQRTEALSSQMEILKKAVDQSTPDDAKFEAWLTAESAINAEIKRTQTELTALVEQQKNMQSLGFPADSSQMKEIGNEIAKTKEKVEGLKTELEVTYDQMGRPVPSEEYKNLQKDLAIVTSEYKNATAALKEFNPKLERMGAIADEVSNKAKKVADSTKYLSAAAGAVAGAIGTAAINAGKYADDINTLAKQTGFSTDMLQGFQVAEDAIDVSFESIISSATKLKKNLRSTSADVQDAWRTLGILPDQMIVSGASMDEIFLDVVVALGKIDNEMQRDLVSMALMGRSADDLAGIVDDSAASFWSLYQGAKETGLILSGDALNSANRFNDALDELKMRAERAFLEAGVKSADTLIPALTKLVDALEKVLDWVSSLDGETLVAIAQIALVVAAISPIAKMISTISGAISALLPVINALSGALGSGLFAQIAAFVASNPFVAVIAAIAAAVAAIAVFGDQFQAALQKADDFLKNVFARDFTEVFGPVFGEAINLLLAHVENVWSGIKTFLDGIIDFVRGVFTGEWSRAWKGIQEVFVGAFQVMFGWMQTIIQAIQSVIDWARNAAQEVRDFLTGSVSVKETSGRVRSYHSNQRVPALAGGGVIEPNNPMLAVLGDNRTEKEIVSPRSEMVSAVQEALGGNAGGNINIAATFTASDDQLVRVLAPKLEAYWARRGAVL